MKNKKVLLLSPRFFKYEEKIQKAIIDIGADVTYVNADPGNVLMTIIAILRRLRLPYKLLIRYFERQSYRNIAGDKYDYILVICGWAITSSLVKKLKTNNILKGGKMILYYWDSISLLKDDPERLKYFDSIFSFDKHDCDSSLGKIKFLPLFYCREYQPLQRTQHTVNLMTVGSYKYNRYVLLENLKKNNPSITIYSHMYISKWLFYFHKMFRPSLRLIEKKNLTFNKISQTQIMDLYRQCDAVLDIPKAGQNGLTIRTFECLAMRKKIITSNPNIIDYDFYNPTNICVIDLETLYLPSKEWFEQEYIEISRELVDKYSISNWINQLLN